MKPIKNCVVCEKEINRSGHNGGKKVRRGKYAVTCSHGCSKIYTRINQLIASRTYHTVKRLEKEIEWLKNENK